MDNVRQSLIKHGGYITGSSSLESQYNAPALAEAGHANYKTRPEHKKKMEKYFHNVFLLSMNNEVLHSGHHSISNYIFTIGAGVKTKISTGI